MKSLRELLTGREPVSLTESATVLEAAALMGVHRIGAVLVVDGAGRPAGIFTERDVLDRILVARRDPATTRLVDVMTRELFTVEASRLVNEVARELQRRHIRHLPVTEGGRVVAVLSLRDLMRAHLDAKRQEVQALTAYIHGEELPQPARPERERA
jgi:CBS domain-containing protein